MTLKLVSAFFTIEFSFMDACAYKRCKKLSVNPAKAENLLFTLALT